MLKFHLIKTKIKIMSENLNKFFESKVSWLLSLIIVILGMAGTFYSLSAKVAVQEEKIAQLELKFQQAQQVSMQYQSLAQSIDQRLSRIEGALAAAK